MMHEKSWTWTKKQSEWKVKWILQSRMVSPLSGQPCSLKQTHAHSLRFAAITPKVPLSFPGNPLKQLKENCSVRTEETTLQGYIRKHFVWSQCSMSYKDSRILIRAEYEKIFILALISTKPPHDGPIVFSTTIP